MDQNQYIGVNSTSAEQTHDSSGNTWITYRLFGVILRSDFSLAIRTPLPGMGKPDVTFTRKLVDSLAFGSWQGIPPSYISPIKNKNGKSVLHAFQRHDGYVLHFPDTADFYLTAECILCHQLHKTGDFEIERWLVGTVLSLWLESRGVPVLHASSVLIEGKAVAFLSTSLAGKSTLAASLMQCGYPLLTDDALALECDDSHCVGHSGYPRMRLWPDQAKHFLGHYEDLELAHPDYSKRNVSVDSDGIGAFCDKSMPVGCIYIPQRKDLQGNGGTVEILSVSSRDAFMDLVCYSFVSRMLSKFGMQEDRMQLLMQVVQRVPIRRLNYPNGLEFLPHVCETIVEDVISLSKDPSKGKQDFIVEI